MPTVNTYQAAQAVYGVDADPNSPTFGQYIAPAGSSPTAPNYTRPSQNTATPSTVTLAANTAQTAIAANANINGARILNYTASPVYLAAGVSGTPASGAPSDYVPAAAGGVPGQWEPPYRPVDGVRAVGASAGNLAVYVW